MQRRARRRVPPPTEGPRTAEEVDEEYRVAMAWGAASAHAQLGVDDAGRRGTEDAIRPSAEEGAGQGAEGETGRGGKEDAARASTSGEKRTDGAAPKQPIGRVGRTGPIPEPTEARDEGATVVESMVHLAPEVVQPAPEVVPVVEMPPEDEPEVMALEQSDDPERVVPNTAPGAAGVAPSWEGGLNAG